MFLFCLCLCLFVSWKSIRPKIISRFEMWRLFLTGAEKMPVVKMTMETNLAELKEAHLGSPYMGMQDRSVRINR